VDLQYQVVFLAVPALLVGVLLWLQGRALDSRAAARHQALVDLLAGHRAGAVAEAQMVNGPESSRRGVAEDRAPFVVVAGEVSDDQVEAIAAELCPRGPRPAEEVALILGCRVVAADLPPELPVFLDGDAILCRDDERRERSILERAAATALIHRGLRPSPANVAAVARRLSRPVSVRSAM
jgi:hypothetical protein